MSIALRRSRGYAKTSAGSPAVAVEGETRGVAPVLYGGLVTRGLAFAVDAAIINAAAIVTSAVVFLTFSVVSIPDELRTLAAATGGALYVLWLVGYFVTFWSTTGQTPGNRVLRIRVQGTGGGPLKP